MSDLTTKEKVQGIKIILGALEEGLKELHAEGVVCNFTIATDKKTVSISSEKEFSIELKATVNQEL
jgi:hypothetical protein